jgi:hypothetical protein
MKTVTIFRADNYDNNAGNLEGFFLNKEDAESVLDYSNPVTIGDGNFGQITEFEVSEKALEGIDVNDTKKMLSEEIWGSGKVTNNYYYA